MQNRLKNDWKGLTLPEGHIEKNESIIDAVIREMKEETGLDIQNSRLCGIKQFPIENGRYIYISYRKLRAVSSEQRERARRMMIANNKPEEV